MKRSAYSATLVLILLILSLFTVAVLPVRANVDSFSLFGSFSQGWGFTAGTISSPGPIITVVQGDLVNLTLTSQDGFSHRFFVDYNGNAVIDLGEPASPSFSGTINFQFNATTAGTFTYYCAFHPGVMHGTFIVAVANPDVAITNVKAEKQFVGQGRFMNMNVTVANNGNVDETFNVTTYRVGGADMLVINGSASAGWNGTIPGPAIMVNLGDTVAMTLTSVDGFPHQFFVDYNGNVSPDPGEPSSPVFSATTTYVFVANVSGTFTYYCAFHPSVMNGTFTVNATPTTTEIASQTVRPPLTPAEVRVLTFTSNSSGMPFGTYTLKAVADTVPGETNTTNNNFTDGAVTVTIPGDLNGDFKVTLIDLVLLANAWGSSPGSSKWNPNADIDGNGLVGMPDLVLLAAHYGRHYP